MPSREGWSLPPLDDLSPESWPSLPLSEGLFPAGLGAGEGWLDGGEGRTAATPSSRGQGLPGGGTTAALAQETSKREVKMTVEKIMLEGVEGRGFEEVRNC